MKTTFIGFGEAAAAFTDAWSLHGSKPEDLRAYDRKTDDAATRIQKQSDYAQFGVRGCGTPPEALAEAALVFSTVTADQALPAARDAAQCLLPGTLYLDCNSVAPETKRAACASIEAGGGRYVDVAVMAPVRSALLNVPLLVAGPHAAAARQALTQLGFRARVVEGGVGAASAIKMIRSIMVKGLEALTAECFLSAHAAGVQDEVLASLEQSYPGFEWPKRADYNLDRMMVHGRRRSAEMVESARTAAALGQTGGMAHATAQWQARIGELGLEPPAGLDAKVRAILPAMAATKKEHT
jgi:3-hydroxyisobutyrate dehydrogenase-like beta-hydroxyacid dehydrogenase